MGTVTDTPPPHKPYVPDNVVMPEFTWSAVLVGAVLGIIFGASSLYLVLKVGLTVSASIPVAVLSITLFRVFSRLPGIRKANILENNIVQTTGSAGESIAFGFGIAFVYQFLWQGLRLWKDTAAKPLSWFKGATPAIEVNPALLGVGYIIGTRISCIMVAGGVLASFVLTPAIRLFGDGLQQPLYPGKIAISQMSEDQVWHDYVLYIGAGAVAAGGIISLIQALPLILSSIKAGWEDIRASRQAGSSGEGVPRTDRDLPLWIVGVGSIALVLGIWVTTPLHDIFQ